MEKRQKNKVFKTYFFLSVGQRYDSANFGLILKKMSFHTVDSCTHCDPRWGRGEDW
jgi:hypothetical protein